MKKKIIIGIAVLMLTVAFLIYKAALAQAALEPEPVPVEVPPEPVTYTATIASIGDVLIHDRVYVEAVTPEGTYDFMPMLEEVKTMLSAPDFLIANQESMPGGTELGLSGYPCFNTPHEITDALIECGVDLFSQANNHTLDKGEEGIQSAIAYYESKGVPYVGMYKSPEDQATPRVFDVNGISIGVMSYTYGTNGIPVPEGQAYLVNTIDLEKMKAEAEILSEEADVVVAVVHWGNEYETVPSAEQQELAQYLADCGVDIIFGSHPHVLQPIEWVTAADGTPTLCVYSLGNFISGQTGDYKDIGGMVEVTISKTVDEEMTTIEFTDVEFYPTHVTMNGPTPYMVVPMEDAPAYGFSSPTKDEVYQFVMGGVNITEPVVMKQYPTIEE